MVPDSAGTLQCLADLQVLHDSVLSWLMYILVSLLCNSAAVIGCMARLFAESLFPYSVESKSCMTSLVIPQVARN